MREVGFELKSLEAWPARPETIVACEHFTQIQRLWIQTRCRVGGAGAVCVLLKVGDDWLLFDGLTACEVLGRRTEDQLRAEAMRTWKSKDMEDGLLDCLAGRD